MRDLGEFSANQLNGEKEELSAYRGKVVLVVNVASECGNTPQYEGLEALWTRYRDKGLVILGFPCNQFGDQEPGSADQIAEFCTLNYGVSFPLFEKIEVNGPDAHPLYKWLTSQAPDAQGNRDVGWNFTKFLVDRSGEKVERFHDKVEPEDLEPAIRALL